MTGDRIPLVKKVRKKIIYSYPLKFFSSVAKGLFICVMLGVITACQSTSVREKSSQNPDVGRSDTQFILDNAILEQSNTQGNLVWKVKSSQTIYSRDRQTAKLENVTANLLEDGEVILQLSSKKGEIRQNGLVILLQGQILVTDPRNRAVVTSEEAEWRPSEQILIVRQGIKGSSDNLVVEAERGKYALDRERLELSGNVVGTTIKPSLRLQTDHLIWFIPQKKVMGDRPLEIVRYQDDSITDRIVANYGEVDLHQNILSLHQEVEMRSLEPALQIATNSVQWNYQTRVVSSEQPIQIIDLENQLDIVGNKGTVDLNRQIANLDNGTKSISHLNQSQLYARQLIWDIPAEQVEAKGNVIYQQTNPTLNLTGDKAVGKLQTNSVVVTGNNRQNQVTTEIVP